MYITSAYQSTPPVVTFQSCQIYSNTASGVRCARHHQTHHHALSHRPIEVSLPFVSRHSCSIFRTEYVLAPNTPPCATPSPQWGARFH